MCVFGTFFFIFGVFYKLHIFIKYPGYLAINGACIRTFYIQWNLHVHFNVNAHLETNTVSGQYFLQEAKVGPMAAVALHTMDNGVVPCTNIDYRV